MRPLKTVKQGCTPTTGLLELMETFRLMLNACILVGLEEDKTAMRSLSLACYPRLKHYTANSRYKLCAISRAAGILRNYRKLSRKHRVRTPYCTRPMLTTCYGLKIVNNRLRIPSGYEIGLNRHTIEVLKSMDLRSVTVNPRGLSVSFSKETQPLECTGMLGIDTNLDNVTVADTGGNVDSRDLAKAILAKSRSRQVRRRFRRNDVRIRRGVFRKHGRIEKNRVGWIIHNASVSVVRHAKEHRMGIVMENIKGIRKLYRRGNRQSRDYRARMNNWSFYDFQRQVEYKARWEGIPVSYVAARGTSAKCSKCGNRMFPKRTEC